MCCLVNGVNKGETMKRILILILTLFLLPLTVFAQGNKWQENLQKRNKQTLQRLQMLGYVYKTSKDEKREKISKDIDKVIEHWYTDNSEAIRQAQVKQTIQKGQKATDPDTIKQQIAVEIKAGKVPEMILTTLSEKDAQNFKRQADIFGRHNQENPQAKENQAGKKGNTKGRKGIFAKILGK